MKRTDNPIVEFTSGSHIDGKPLTAKFIPKINENPDQDCIHCDKKISVNTISYNLILDYYGVNVCGKCVHERLCILNCQVA